jgi:hypothetical protein
LSSKSKYKEVDFKRTGKNGIIRNKNEREKLKGFNCELCQEVILFYSLLLFIFFYYLVF